MTWRYDGINRNNTTCNSPITGYFIEETWFSHTIGNDYWLGRTDSEERTYLSDRWDDALRKAEDQMDQK